MKKTLDYFYCVLCKRSHDGQREEISQRCMDESRRGHPLKIDTIEPPAELLLALEKSRDRLQYTTPYAVYNVLWLWSNSYCGVFGDGPNGSYEWFLWDGSKLETSNCGYGSPNWALRDVLNKIE